jgi:hypothetical protein
MSACPPCVSCVAWTTLHTRVCLARARRYDITRDGARVVVWCTDSVPFPNMYVVDIMSQNKISVYCHEGLVRQVRRPCRVPGAHAHSSFDRAASRAVATALRGCVAQRLSRCASGVMLTLCLPTVTQAMFTPNGDRIISCGSDSKLQVGPAAAASQSRVPFRARPRTVA